MVNKYYNATSELPSNVFNAMNYSNKCLRKSENEFNSFYVPSCSIQHLEIGKVYYIVNDAFNAVKLDAIVVTEHGFHYCVHTPDKKNYVLVGTRLYTKEEYLSIINNNNYSNLEWTDAYHTFDIPNEYECNVDNYNNYTSNIRVWRWIGGQPCKKLIPYKAFWKDKYGTHFILDIDDDELKNYYYSREDCVNANLVFDDDFSDDEDDKQSEKSFTINIEITMIAKTEQEAMEKCYQKYGITK